MRPLLMQILKDDIATAVNRFWGMVIHVATFNPWVEFSGCRCTNLSNGGWDELITLCNFCIWVDDWANREMQEKWTRIFKIVTTLPFKVKKYFFFQQESIELIKSDSNDIYNVTKYFSFKCINKCCSFDITIHQIILIKSFNKNIQNCS